MHFNKAFLTGRELFYMSSALLKGKFSGGGEFTLACEARLRELMGGARVFLTSSCSSALEAAAIAAGIGAGDEVVMPSFTFPSTANAIVLRGAVPVFADIREDTLNLDERLIEAALGERSKAIMPVHYGGTSCEMDAITELAGQRHLQVIEDAAQGILASYKGRPLGSMGHFGALSFHDTKNITCGEGGALIVRQPEQEAEAELVLEFGTDRRAFMRGEVPGYSWHQAGLSCMPGELAAAFLLAQLEQAEAITAMRLNAWRFYHERLEDLEQAGLLRRPGQFEDRVSNGHIYYLLLNTPEDRKALLRHLTANGIHAVSHYVPLHLSGGGRRYGKISAPLPVTESCAARLIRLPLYAGIDENSLDSVTEAVRGFWKGTRHKNSG